MNDQLWSWVLTVVGITGFILAGRKVWWCWYINIGCQALWFTYAIVTEQYGFIVASLMYTFVFTKNAIAWTKEHREKVVIERKLSEGSIIQYQETFDDLGSDHRQVIRRMPYQSFKEIFPNRPDSENPHKGVDYEVTDQDLATPNNEYCGQTQPHPPHIWARGHLGIYTNCSGHA